MSGSHSGGGQLSPKTIYIFMGLMVLTGSINTVANKLQQSTVSLGKVYSHPWFITFCMFLGEITCLLAYFIQKYRESKKIPLLEENENLNNDGKEEVKEASVFILAIPALCDFFGSTIMTIGLSMMAGSVYQMFRGSLILFTALFSKVFLKGKIYRHNYLALVFIISGLALVGIGSTIYGEEGAETKVMGVILVIIAQLFSAAQFIIEEKFLKNYHVHPLRAVGWEGVWGAGLYLIIMVIFQFIECPSTWDPATLGAICVQIEDGTWKVEDSLFAIRQIFNNGLLCFYVILYIFSIAIFNFVGISVTKYVSSPARAVVDTIRTVVIWIFFLTIPFVPESTKEKFIWLQLVGFVILVLGTVIYNEVLVLPFLGLDYFTKSKMAEREKAGNPDNTLVTV